MNIKSITPLSIVLLFCIALIAAAFVYFLLVPNTVFTTSTQRDSIRERHTMQLLDAVTSYLDASDAKLMAVDSKAQNRALPACPEGAFIIKERSNLESESNSESIYINLEFLVPEYLTNIPTDPLSRRDSSINGYQICITPNDRIQVSAPKAELSSISVQR